MLLADGGVSKDDDAGSVEVQHDCAARENEGVVVPRKVIPSCLRIAVAISRRKQVVVAAVAIGACDAPLPAPMPIS